MLLKPDNEREQPEGCSLCFFAIDLLNDKSHAFSAVDATKAPIPASAEMEVHFISLVIICTTSEQHLNDQEQIQADHQGGDNPT